MIKKYAVKSKKVYTKDGQTKNLWMGIGTLVQFDNGSMILELNMMPGEQYSVFPLDEQKTTIEDIAY